jgi:hypothetical protein
MDQGIKEASSRHIWGAVCLFYRTKETLAGEFRDLRRGRLRNTVNTAPLIESSKSIARVISKARHDVYPATKVGLVAVIEC